VSQFATRILDSWETLARFHEGCFHRGFESGPVQPSHVRLFPEVTYWLLLSALPASYTSLYVTGWLSRSLSIFVVT
jgi:hypothetical protein